MVIDKTFLPFPADLVRQHFLSDGNGKPRLSPDRQLTYLQESAERYRKFHAAHPSRRSLPLSTMKADCQIEKDERFWTAGTLMSLYHSEDRMAHFEAVLRRSLGDRRPVDGRRSWRDLLEGELQLYFEVQLPSPVNYRTWIGKHLSSRQPVRYVRDAARHPKEDRNRSDLEGATCVDAILINRRNGFAVLFEAKVTSDLSCQVSFDSLRNQLARSIDVGLESNPKLLSPLNQRKPELTYVVLLTPRLYKVHPHTRLYGWLMQDYLKDPKTLARDLPHRRNIDWKSVSRRIGWLTWEDCREICPTACPWLDSERPD